MPKWLQKIIDIINGIIKPKPKPEPLEPDKVEVEKGFDVKTLVWVGTYRGQNSKIKFDLDKVDASMSRVTFCWPKHTFNGGDGHCDGLVCVAWKSKKSGKWTGGYFDYKYNAQGAAERSWTYDAGQLANVYNAGDEYGFDAEYGEECMWWIMGRDCADRSNALPALWPITKPQILTSGKSTLLGFEGLA